MTFSIIGKKIEDLGVGVVSGSVAVRRRVPWVKKKVGAVVTQGYTLTEYGRKGLSLLEQREDPKQTLKSLMEEDLNPERRQVAIMNKYGSIAIHTGSSCPKEMAEKEGKNCLAIGNMLKTKQTVLAMVKDFERSDGSLSFRILRALKRGAELGGDRRGNRTAALVVSGEKEEVDIGIDSHQTPVRELERRYDSQQ